VRASRVAVLIAVALVGAAAAAVLPPASRDVVVRGVIVIVGIWITRILVGRMRATTSPQRERFDERRVRSTIVPTEIPGLNAIEAALRMSMAHALGVEILLGRLFRDVARWRLQRHRGIDLELDPIRARRASGDALWPLIGPEALAAGAPTRIPKAALDAAIDDLERI